MGANETFRRTSRQADGAERARTVGRTRAETMRTVERTGGQGPRGADMWTGGRGTDGAQEARTGPSMHRRTDGQTGQSGPPLRRRADGRTRRSGAEESRTGGRGVRWSGGRAYWQSAGRADGRIGERADERVGLGLKGYILRGWVHSWAPSPLASSKRECAGCLGVQWSPVRFHVKHPYLEPGLTYLV